MSPWTLRGWDDIVHFVLFISFVRRIHAFYFGKSRGVIHLFPAENHGLRLGGTDSHPDRFTLGCKMLQSILEIMVRRRQQNNRSESPLQYPGVNWEAEQCDSHSTGTVSDLHTTQERCVNQAQQCPEPSANLAYTRRLATEELFKYLRDHCQRIWASLPLQSSDSASMEDMLDGFRSFSKCSFHHLTISPVWISRSLPLLVKAGSTTI